MQQLKINRKSFSFVNKVFFFFIILIEKEKRINNNLVIDLKSISIYLIKIVFFFLFNLDTGQNFE